MTTSFVEAGERERSVRLLRVLWIVLTVGLVLAARHLPWGRAVEQLARIRPSWVILALLANLMILPLWAMEWRILVPGVVRVAYGRMLEVVCITGAVLNSVPLFAGEVSGVALLVTRAGLSYGAALSVLALDQLLVGFAKLTVLAAAAFYAPLPPWLRAGLVSLIVAFTSLLVILVSLAHHWGGIEERLLLRPSRVRRVMATVVSWGAHLEVLRETRRAWSVAVLSLAKKAFELLAIIAIQVAFGVEPSLTAGLLVLAALAVTTLLPIAPANLGVYEATVFASYRFVGVSTETAMGIAVVQHLCFLLPPLAVGYAVATGRHLRSRSARDIAAP